MAFQFRSRSLSAWPDASAGMRAGFKGVHYCGVARNNELNTASFDRLLLRKPIRIN